MRKHLTVEQRSPIFAILQTDTSQKDIARVIGVNKSTISRKLRRNYNDRSGEYVAWVEQQINNRSRKRLGYLTSQEKLNQFINNKVALAT